MAAKATTTKPKPLKVIEDFGAILAADDRETETVEMPEWGGSVVIRKISLAENDVCREQSMIKGELDEDKYALVVIQTALVSPPMTFDQIEQLRSKSASSVLRLSDAVQRLNWTDKGALEAALKSFRDESGE